MKSQTFFQFPYFHVKTPMFTSIAQKKGDLYVCDVTVVDLGGVGGLFAFHTILIISVKTDDNIRVVNSDIHKSIFSVISFQFPKFAIVSVGY